MTDNQHYLYMPHEDSVQMQILHPNTAEEDVLGLRQWRLQSELTAELHGASPGILQQDWHIGKTFVVEGNVTRRTETMLWREREDVDERLQNYFRRLEQIRRFAAGKSFCFIKEDEDEELFNSDNDDEEDEESGSDGDTEDNEEDEEDEEDEEEDEEDEEEEEEDEGSGQLNGDIGDEDEKNEEDDADENNETVDLTEEKQIPGSKRQKRA